MLVESIINTRKSIKVTAAQFSDFFHSQVLYHKAGKAYYICCHITIFHAKQIQAVTAFFGIGGINAGIGTKEAIHNGRSHERYGYDARSEGC